jgi:hypothetical protein
MAFTSRKKRKRCRQRAAKALAGGDRVGSLPGGVGGPSLRPDWSEATRGDLRLLGHAVHCGWPVPGRRRRSIVEAVGKIFSKTPSNANAGRIIAAARVFLRMDRQNLETEREALRCLRN